MSLSGSKPKAPVIKPVSIPYCGLFATLRSNYSLKRTAAYRWLCYHAVTRQRPLSSSVRPLKAVSLVRRRLSVHHVSSSTRRSAKSRSGWPAGRLQRALLVVPSRARPRVRRRTGAGARGFSSTLRRSGARSWRASRCFVAPASRAQSVFVCRWRACLAGHDCSASLPGWQCMRRLPFGTIGARRLRLRQLTCLTHRSSGPLRIGGSAIMP